MRGHVKAGYDMIVRALGYPPSYAHIIAEHHERCDGSGYPAGRGRRSHRPRQSSWSRSSTPSTR